VFDFGTAVLDSWTIDFTVNLANDNASIWAGNGLASLDDLLGLDFAALVSTAGFDLIDGNVNVALNDPYSFAGSYRYLVVSAQFNQDNDNFRIGSISTNLVSAPAPAPAPAPWALALAGLIGLIRSQRKPCGAHVASGLRAPEDET
jgi:MYXO-CTERM domain-containing protein